MRRSSIRAAALLLLAMATLAGCATTQEDMEGPLDLVGCYQFERNDGARALNLPWGFELRADELDVGLDGARLAVSRRTWTETADHPFRYWVVLEDGTVRVGYPGRGAYELNLRPEGLALVGEGRDVGDVIRPGETVPRAPQPVIAQRVLCPDVSGG